MDQLRVPRAAGDSGERERVCSAVFPGSRMFRKGFAQRRADGVMPEGYTRSKSL